MKIHTIKIFRILFLGIILYGYGINAYSIDTIKPIIAEQSSGTNNLGNTVISDVDIFDDDQPDLPHGCCSFSELRNEISVVNNYILIRPASFSIWQPPKIS